jgi:transposase-like protein
MGKHKKWTLDDKVKIVKDFKKGATISYLNNKYGISGVGTVSRWNKEYDEGMLGVDNRGKRKNQKEIEDIDILKKSYALLMEIRSQ